MQLETQSESYSPNGTQSYGARERLRHVFDGNRTPEERQNTMKLLANNQQLPRHLRERFFNNPEYPANKLVDRLKSLAEVNPDVRKKAKGLLDQLNNFFDPEKESAPEENQVAQEGLLPEAQPEKALQLPQRQLKEAGVPPEESARAVLSDLGAQLPLPGSASESAWPTTIRCQALEIEELRALCRRAADTLSIWHPRNALIAELQKAAE
jgi:hypothetical protein